MRRHRIVSLLVALALSFACSAVFAQKHEGFETISADDLKKAMESNERLLIIDSRTEEEYAQGHLPGAVNIFPKRYAYIGGYLPKDKDYPLVFYCKGYG